ncbi:hypothetical protein GGQ80_003633 [Sphingomonas jinjuensis]|uniref:Uncharacterized protein n=1 Tax=Sphingomonas jinjuensis TaxID=535907 RepID=A0A840FP95_9SPHN|nr:hypothetical protein [Sphingomonas jinjuensis]MBB4155708.1 hypothetical protein [Sphingomonas jinjuensis]
MASIWLFVVVGGPILLGLAILYARTRNRVSPRQEAKIERATQRLYKQESRKDDRATR